MASVRDLQSNSSMRCAKFLLLVVSFMFAFTAVLLVMIGSTIGTIFGDFRQFVDDKFSSPPTLLVVIGFILLAVAFFGAYGAIRESVLLINLYGVFLFFVFVLEFSAALSAFILQTHVRDMLVETMQRSLAQYEKNEYVQTGVDYMQRGLECCGIDGPADWKPYWSPNQNSSYRSEYNEIYVPASCCGEFSSEDVDRCEIQYDYGCLRRMDYLISQSTLLIGTGALTVSLVQLLGVLCALMLAKTLRRNKSLREARRWQLQQSLGVLIPGGKVTQQANSGKVYTQLQPEKQSMADPSVYTSNSPSVN